MMTSSSVSAHDLLIDNPFPGIQLVTPTHHDHHDHEHIGGHYYHNWISQHQDHQVGSDDGLNRVMDGEKGIDQARDWEDNWVPCSSKLKVAKKMNPKRASTANPTMPIVEISTDEFPYFLPAENDSSSVNSESNANNNNNIGIRVCSDCNTTKTPLWRSGPKGPKSLCNACGIRQRKARRALAAAAVADSSDNNALTKVTTSSPKSLKIKTSNNNINKKIKTSTTSVHNDNTEQWQQPYKKRLKKFDDQYTSVSHDSNPSSEKNGEYRHRFGKGNIDKRICFEEFITRSLSKNAALHRVFPQDEKEAAILLMALSCGLVHN